MIGITLVNNMEAIRRLQEQQEQERNREVPQVDGILAIDLNACTRTCRVQVWNYNGAPMKGSDVTVRLEHGSSDVDCTTSLYRGVLVSRRVTTQTDATGRADFELPTGATAYWTIPDAGVFDAPMSVSSGAGVLNVVDSLRTAGQVT